MKKNLLLLFTSACLLSCLAQSALAQGGLNTQQWKAAATYEYIYIDTVVKGGDNLDLVTRIYLPKGEGPWPVVVTRTPYPTAQTKGDNLAQGQLYVRRGLGYIQQYCRGKGGSEGVYEPNIYEREDGLALVNWVAGQEWCRSIGLFGASYTALTAWIVADQLPDKVKGIYLHHYGIDRHLSAYKDGLFRQDILTGWAIDNASEITNKPPKDRDEPFYEQARYMPHVEMDVKMLGVELPWYRDWITHTDYNDPYWQQGVWAQLKSIPPKINVPMTIVAGLFDHHLEGTVAGYERLSPATKAQSRLVIGSWNHYYQITPTAHDPQHARDLDVQTDQFNWLYDVVVMGTVPKGDVRVYFVGADRWVTFDSWPVRPDGETTFYLTNQLSKENEQAHALTTTQPSIAGRSALQYTYDPQNPVMSVGGETLFNSPKRRGSQPQPPIGYRDDVLSFLSEPLSEVLTICGPIQAVIRVSSDCEDTSFTYKVSEVLPDGTAYNIRSGITTLAYRNDRFANRQTYTPNEVVDLSIETLPVTWQVKAGHRIRIDITSSNFPEYSIHSNYPGVWSKQSLTRQASQTVYIEGSRIMLPTITLE